MRIVVVDEHKLMLAGIRMALQHEPDIEIVAEGTRPSELLPLMAATAPDAVLLGLRAALVETSAYIRLLRMRYPRVKVVLLSATTDTDEIRAAARHGANGFIGKRIRPPDLAPALRRAVAGNFYCTLGLRELDDDACAHEAGLTDREIVILRAVAHGHSNKRIAKDLWITEQTVKYHLTNIYRKLHVANRTEAARCAYRLGLVESPVLSAV